MATYQGIKGRTVQNLASDPPAAVGSGQVWYNTTAGTLKTSVQVGAWASGTTLNGPGSRYNVCGFGILTAGAMVGGYGPPDGATRTSETTEYDGTTWTIGGAMVQQASDGTSSGPLTGAFCAGGYTGSYVNASATYDGTSWTAAGLLTDGARGLPQNQSFGTGSAGAVFGGPNAGTNVTEEFDGTSWAGVNNMPTVRGGGAGGGTQTDAFAAAGFVGSYPTVGNTSITYDGTSWTASNPVNTGRARAGGSTGGGAASLGFFCGGSTAPTTYVTAAEEFDGTSWASMPSLATARVAAAVFGTKTAGVIAGGTPSDSSVEEFTLADTVQTITSTT